MSTRKKLDERSERLQKMATRAHIINSWGASPDPEPQKTPVEEDDDISVELRPDVHSAMENELFDSSNHIPRAQLEESLERERDHVTQLEQQLGAFEDKLAREMGVVKEKDAQLEKMAADLKRKEDEIAQQTKDFQAQRNKIETDANKALKSQEEKFEEKQRKQLESSKADLIASEQIPLLVGKKQFLIPRELLTSDSCPSNDLTRIIKGEKDFEIRNGFVQLDCNPDSFQILLDYLENPDLDLPDDSETLDSLTKLADKLNVPDLKEKCEKQKILNSAGILGSVIHLEKGENVADVTSKTTKIVVSLVLSLNSDWLTNASVVSHYNVFHRLSRHLKRHFCFVYIPENNLDQFLRWEFYQSGQKIHSLEFQDRTTSNKTQGDKFVHVRHPKEGAMDESNRLTKTIPETFLTLMTNLKLSNGDKTMIFDIKWWYQNILDN